MIRWLRRMLGLSLSDRRAQARVQAQYELRPIPSTLPELVRTGPAHRRRIQNADAFLRDIAEMDAALRLVRR